jgi:two-component system, NarL family, sensor kinase
MDFFSEDITIIFFASAFLIVVAVGIIILILLYQKRQLSHLKEKNEMKNNFEKELLKSQLEIQEQTLKNISQEIHDNVGQVLTLAKLNLATTTVAESTANEKIKTSQQLIGKAIQDLRDLSRSLNTDYVEDLGLVRSIEYELELLQKTGTIVTELSIEGKIVRLDKQRELILFRIVQEAIHNIIKHAEAKKISASIHFNDEAITILIKDNGKGFDLSPLNDAGNQSFGLGLRNMNNRAKLIAAVFSVTSTIGKGTEVSLQLPVNENENEGTTKN